MIGQNDERAPGPVPANAHESAFRALFEAELSYVCRSLRRCGVREADVEDLAHDVFLAVHSRPEAYDPTRPIKPWLFGISFRIASHYKRRPGYKREELGVERAEAPDAAPLADAKIETDQKRALVLAALDALDDDRRAVLVMHDLDELPMKDIAEVLGVPLFTGYSRLRAAREQFAAAARRLQPRGGHS